MVEAKTKVESSVEFAEVQFFFQKKKPWQNIHNNHFSFQRVDNSDVLPLPTHIIYFISFNLTNYLFDYHNFRVFVVNHHYSIPIRTLALIQRAGKIIEPLAAAVGFTATYLISIFCHKNTSIRKVTQDICLPYVVLGLSALDESQQ